VRGELEEEEVEGREKEKAWAAQGRGDAEERVTG
jgi:hypothetical protein